MWTIVFSSFGYIPKSESTRSYNSMSNFLRYCWIVFQRVPFYSFTSSAWGFYFLNILANTCYCLPNLQPAWWVYYIQWCCISLMTNDVEQLSHVFIHHLYAFFGKLYLNLLSIFKLGYLLLSWKSSLCILGISPFSEIWFVNILFYSIICFSFL